MLRSQQYSVHQLKMQQKGRKEHYEFRGTGQNPETCFMIFPVLLFLDLPQSRCDSRHVSEARCKKPNLQRPEVHLATYFTLSRLYFTSGDWCAGHWLSACHLRSMIAKRARHRMLIPRTIIEQVSPSFRWTVDTARPAKGNTSRCFHSICKLCMHECFLLRGHESS